MPTNEFDAFFEPEDKEFVPQTRELDIPKPPFGWEETGLALSKLQYETSAISKLLGFVVSILASSSLAANPISFISAIKSGVFKEKGKEYLSMVRKIHGKETKEDAELIEVFTQLLSMSIEKFLEEIHKKDSKVGFKASSHASVSMDDAALMLVITHRMAGGGNTKEEIDQLVDNFSSLLFNSESKEDLALRLEKNLIGKQIMDEARAAIEEYLGKDMATIKDFFRNEKKNPEPHFKAATIIPLSHEKD